MCERNGGKPCSWGESCNFAHSAEELRPYYDLTKTKMCPTQIASGVCKKTACRFAHCVSELRSTEMFYKTQLCIDFNTEGKCQNGFNCRHAHGEHELRLSPEPLYTIHDHVKFARAHRKIRPGNKSRKSLEKVSLTPLQVSLALPAVGIMFRKTDKDNSSICPPDQSTTDSLTKCNMMTTITLSPAPGFPASPHQHIERPAVMLSNHSHPLQPIFEDSPLCLGEILTPLYTKDADETEHTAQQSLHEHEGHLKVTLESEAEGQAKVSQGWMTLLGRLRHANKRLEKKSEYCRAVLALSEKIQISLCKWRDDREAGKSATKEEAEVLVQSITSNTSSYSDGALFPTTMTRAALEQASRPEIAGARSRRPLAAVE